jgi:hypothetical protein
MFLLGLYKDYDVINHAPPKFISGALVIPKGNYIAQRPSQKLLGVARLLPGESAKICYIGIELANNLGSRQLGHNLIHSGDGVNFSLHALIKGLKINTNLYAS